MSQEKTVPAHRRVLILTADAGFGHRSAANAVAAALEERYSDRCDYWVVNPLEDRRAPFFLRDSQTDYDKLVRNMPELYRFGYDASDSHVPGVIVEQALTVLLFEVMRDLVRTYNPDVILTTYPLYQAPLRAALTVARRSVPILTSVTDLATVHRLWFYTGTDRYMVPTTVVRDLALNYGIPLERIEVTGIPVNPEVARDRRTTAQIRQELGWEQDLITIFAVGSKRVDRLIDSLNVLNHFGVPLQVAVAAGNDSALYQQLNEMEWHIPVRLYEFVSNATTMMRAADIVMCKAGGLVITESLACGRPLLLIDAIPGQETGNADYVVQNGAGELVLSPIEVLEATAHWLRSDGSLLQQRARHACQLGRSQAAYDVAEMVWQAALNRPKKAIRAAGRPNLLDLLSRNQINVIDEPAAEGEG